MRSPSLLRNYMLLGVAAWIGLSGHAVAGRVSVEKVLILTPPPGANDVHLEVYQKEKSADILDLDIQVGPGQPAGTNTVVGGVNQGNIPAGNNVFGGPPGPLPEQDNVSTWVEAGIETQVGGGGPPFADPLVITLNAVLAGKNVLRTRGFWTQNGVPGDILGPPGGPSIGPATPDFFSGKNKFKHTVKIFNDGTSTALFENVSYVTSQTELDLLSINFPDPVIQSQMVSPGDHLLFDILTDGSLQDGFIYLSYAATGSGLQQVLFEHPVTEVVPEPTSMSMLVVGCVTLSCFRRRRQNRSTCEGQSSTKA